VAAPAAPRDPNLPAGEADAKATLEKSPRHGELVDVKMASGAPVKTWIVYPERKDKAGVVIVIHEIFGLSDWIRGVADQLARDGFIAVAPDLISGHGPGGGGTDSAGSRDDVVKLIRELTPRGHARLNAIRAWAIKPRRPTASATIGFCWGGGQSFAYAARASPRAERGGRLLRRVTERRGAGEDQKASGLLHGGDTTRGGRDDPAGRK
jgi:carboxymethylenebutenolidase